MHRKWGLTDHLFAADTASGLYNAKLELSTLWRRIFTVEDLLAIVPTGSEKTAVLMMLPFVLRSTRILIKGSSKDKPARVANSPTLSVGRIA
jgi:hypothetical protein